MNIVINEGARPANEPTEAAAAEHVRGLFNSIAPTYDRLNHLLSFGLDRHWWRRAARSFRTILANPSAQVVDICCGTGDMTAALLALRPHSELSSRPKRTVRSGETCSTTAANLQPNTVISPLIGLDFSAEMLARARTKFANTNTLWLEGDAMHLPFADNSIDLVTAAFGFRNLTNYAAALVEIQRVLKPGGHIGILEANHPGGLSGKIYSLYFKHILPLAGGVLSGDRAAYRYLPASVERFPRPPQMLAMFAEAGFTTAAWDRYLLGAAGLYRARKPVCEASRSSRFPSP